MIREGLVKLAQADAGVQAFCAPSGGGFFGSLPKDQPLPSWSYSIISTVPSYTLGGRNPLTMVRWQVDLYAADPDSVVRFGAAFDKVFNGYSGLLPDTDVTVLQGAFLTDSMDYFDDLARTYRRMLEYEIYFNQP
jgi:hypothetical protein